MVLGLLSELTKSKPTLMLSSLDGAAGNEDRADPYMAQPIAGGEAGTDKGVD